MTSPGTSEPLGTLRDRVQVLLRAVDDEEVRRRADIDGVLPKHRQSAVNLAHYLGLRSQDIHHLQLELAGLGLSSLGRCEGHVRDVLVRLLGWLGAERPQAGEGEPLDWARSEAVLHANTQALFGPRPSDRHVYIMVTAPDAAGITADWADELLRAGTDLLRINGAHASPAEWAVVASTFKARAAALGKPGRVIVDLPGPKLRADITELEPGVLHWPRCKDRLGRTVGPTTVRLVAEYETGRELPVPAQWLSRLQAGDVIDLTDSGGRQRALVVDRPADRGVLAHCEGSLYASQGLPLVWRRADTVVGQGQVGALPSQPKALQLGPGDAFALNATGRSDDPALPALLFPEPALLRQVRPGEPVVLDDGKITAVVETARADGLLCRVQRTLTSPIRLRSGKGIAFPHSELALNQLGPQDEQALAFALEHADGVGVSFVSAPGDVALVSERIRSAARPGFGMILKLETRGAIHNLPGILFEALKHDPVGLMIARGDLAVELSFERLAEMQEELLWFGEACHLPVIWATQVLDSVAHSGLPTRAEVTDAAMAMRAECVMLNKGPFVAEAARMLATIIRKMEAHQYKKRALYRRLSVAAGRALE